ncbi:MAG: hypothetical protein Q4G09_03295 [Clostridia bacterium]|nr:hypothetical protein [Clostridia bacterium]
MQNYHIIVLVFYLHGDIEQSEKDILNKYLKTNILNSTIIKIAHHGSKNSSKEEFLQQVNPKIALIGAGVNNKFGHPSNKTIEKLNQLRL